MAGLCTRPRKRGGNWLPPLTTCAAARGDVARAQKTAGPLGDRRFFFVSDLKDQAKATLVTRGRRRIAAPIAPKPISVIAQVAGSGTLGAGGTARLAEAE